MVAAGKPLAAFLTIIRFLSRVLSHVNNTIGVLSERFAAEITTEGFFTGVNPRMQNKLMPLIKLLVAFGAFKGLVLVCVPFVLGDFAFILHFAKFEMIACGKTFPTFSTKVRFLPSVQPHVSETT